MIDRIIFQLRRLVFSLLLAGMVAALPLTAHSAATIVIVNGNAPGVGFNDLTPVAPVGGNTGTTLGAQRLIAFQAAAALWGAQLASVPVISIYATFEPLACTDTSALLGFAGPVSVWRDFSGAPFPGTLYPNALANALFGSDITTGNPDPADNAEIRARFNLNLGQSGCLTGTPFYLGLDNNHGDNIDLVTVLLHEFAHGLGFSTTTNGATGAYLFGFPNIYDRFTFDLTANKSWFTMTDAERVASAINPRKVVWTGANVSSGVLQVLQPGTPVLTISAPASVAGNYLVGTADFGPPLASPGVSGQVMPISGNACSALTGANALAANGNIVLIDRGTCTFVVKVKNAQNAGAIGVLIADNVTGNPPDGLGGTDPTITITSVRITLEDGNKLKDALRFRSRTRSGVLGNLSLNLAVRAGADPANRALLFTPNPFQSTSSVLHWDTSAFPNLLMEPYINDDLTHAVMVPFDLTIPLLLDIGWQ